MLGLPKMDDYLKILTDDEVKDFAVINLIRTFLVFSNNQVFSWFH